MIALKSDCLLFQLANGESVPCSAEMIHFEISGISCGLLEPETLRQPPLPYFTISEPNWNANRHRRRIRHGAGKSPARAWLRHPRRRHRIADAGAGATDLGRLARESADSLELFFFPRLRNELRTQLRQSPRVVRFRGLRGCVSNSPVRAGGAAAAKHCRTRLSSICAAASPPSRSRTSAPWWWNDFSSANFAN